MSWLSKIWIWWRENWRWVVFPVGITMFLASAASKLRPIQPGLDVGKIEEAGQKKMMEISQANKLRDAKLEELADAHQERLALLSDDQEEELEELAEKPIEEVVKWFDKL